MFRSKIYYYSASYWATYKWWNSCWCHHKNSWITLCIGFWLSAPYFNLEQDVFCEGTNHFLNYISLPTFIFKEEDVIKGTPSHKIIVETLHPEMMVMSGSQPMTFVLCQVVSFPPLKENAWYRLREISSTTNETHCPQIQYILDDVSLCGENSDQMEGVPVDQYME